MVSLLIRNVDEALHDRLKARAAEHRRSLEEEAREVPRAALARQEMRARENLVDIALHLFGPEHGVELDIPERAGPESPPFDFSERKHER
jgi:plasmid stability protein